MDEKSLLRSSVLANAAIPGFRTAYDSSSKQTHLYVSADDLTFQKKIELALEKNLNYIARLDELAAAAAASGIPWYCARDSAVNQQMKFLKLFNPARKHVKTGIGIKAEAKSRTSSTSTDTRVYVTNLPNDITQEEIEILFGPQGKIKKIKLYTDAAGKPKGDALITFSKPESVISSIVKLNGLDIGDGHKIIVQAADYTFSVQAQEASNSIDQNEDECYSKDSWIVQDSIAEKLRRFLPREFNFVSLPIVIITGGFSFEMDEATVMPIEALLMVEACKFGDIDIIQSIILSLSPSDDSSANWAQICAAINGAGIFVITFKNEECAQRFVSFVNLRHAVDHIFHSREILGLLLPSAKKSSQSHAHINPYACQTRADLKAENDVALPISSEAANDSSTSDCGADPAIQQEADDVEDFLNSLL